jgi:putative toxin-antitoxin system antitoxin component (TIGR02293 family)
MSAIAKRIDSIQARSGISGREIAQLLRTTPQTVSRWRQGHATPQPESLHRLLKLDWLADQLSSIYTPDEAKLWLFKPHADLDGERPADLIASGRIDGVLDLIDRLQSGAYF